MSKSVAPVTTPVDLRLRSHQLQYLRQLGERWDIRMSQVLKHLLQRKISSASAIHDHGAPQKKDRTHLMVAVNQLDYVDTVSARTGLSRSEVVRRVINEAMESDVLGSELQPTASEFMRWCDSGV